MVHQIPIVSHSLLRRMYVAIAGARPVAVHVEGDWLRDVAGGIPDIDRDLPVARATGHLMGLQAAFDTGVPGTFVRAALYYPPGGGLGWHTNSARPGWRVYVPYLPDACPMSGTVTAHGCFPDRHGHANLFNVTEWRQSWHAVYALTERFSVGLLVDQAFVDTLLN